MKARLTAASLLLFLAGLSNPPAAQAAYAVDVVMFYGQGCPHCAVMESHLRQLKGQYSTLVVTAYEVYQEPDNIGLFRKYAAAYGIEIGGVPTLFIGKKAVVGARQNEVDSLVADCYRNGCVNPADFVAGEAGPAAPAEPGPSLPSPPVSPTPSPTLKAAPANSIPQLYDTAAGPELPPPASAAERQPTADPAASAPSGNSSTPRIRNGLAAGLIVLVLGIIGLVASRRRH